MHGLETCTTLFRFILYLLQKREEEFFTARRNNSRDSGSRHQPLSDKYSYLPICSSARNGSYYSTLLSLFDPIHSCILIGRRRLSNISFRSIFFSLSQQLKYLTTFLH
jgi:hypothetical protein